MKTALMMFVHASGRRQRRGMAALAVVVAGLGASLAPAPPAHAQTWTNGAGTGLWSNNANWSATPGLNRVFGDTAVGASTADGNRSGIWQFTVSNTTGTHAVNLDAGTLAFGQFPQLEIGNSTTGAIEFSNGTISLPLSGSQPLRLGRAQTAAASGTLTGTATLQASMGFNGLSTVGYADAGSNGSATMNLADSDNGSLTFASIRAGFASTSGTATAAMSFGDSWAFSVGSLATRGEFVLGRAGTSGTASGSWTAGNGGSFTAYTNTFDVGAGDNVTSKTGTLSLAGIDNGLIDHNGGTRTFNVGRGTGSGTVTLGSNWTVNVNTGNLVSVGVDGGTGSLTGTNLTLSGSAGFMYVGATDQTGASGTGTLDMGGGSFGSGFSVGTLRVGVGGNSTGTLKLGSGTSNLTGSADIGDSTSSGVEGLMELRDTLFTAGTSSVVTIGNSGRMNILVSDTSSGLVLNRAASAALVIADTVAAGNGILATFQNNPTGFDFLGTAQSHDSIYWAIKWAGDQSSLLATFINDGKIGWNTSGLTGGLAGATPQVIFDADDNATYLGLYVSAVPEPGTLALASCGLALAAGWSLRRRGRRA